MPDKILSREAVGELTARLLEHGMIGTREAILANDAEQRARIKELERELRQSRTYTENACNHAMQHWAALEAIGQALGGVKPNPTDEGTIGTSVFYGRLCTEISALRKRVADMDEDAFTVIHLRGILDRVRSRGGMGSDKSDSAVAGAIRMMTRDDLDHEMVCVMARDRIIALSDAVDSLRKERDVARDNLDQLKIEIINASQCVGYYGDDTDSAITCLTSAIAQAEPRILKAEEERDTAIEAGKADKARADANWASCERIKGKLSDHHNELSALRTKLEASTQPVDLPVTTQEKP